MQRDIQDVVETLKNARDANKACTLLIGAGCSVKAGIPLAAEFIDIICKKYPHKSSQVKEKTYPNLMGRLSMGERRDLISKYIDDAKINWAHIGIAQLIKHDFVDRVLTVNFDPLVQRACAMVGVFPAVYDFAASQYFNSSFIAHQSIFHLHGQRSGFVVLNTGTEVEKLSKHLKPVFDDALRGRVCIVVGYSGENDPVFTNLAAIDRFDNNLYWVGYKDSEPAEHVRKEILEKEKDAFHVSGFDSDDFFVTLAQKLECFPPDFVGKPFSHLRNLIADVSPYSLPGQAVSVADSADSLIQEAIDRFEKGSAETTEKHPLALKANDLLLAGKYDEIIAMTPEFARTPSPELADAIAWAYVGLGNEKYDQALTKSGKKADRLFAQSYDNYEAAIKIQPDKQEAFFNWGNTLSEQAKTKSGEEANGLFAQSYEKFEVATKMRPEDHEAFNNWGIALSDHAGTKSGEEADKLFTQSYEKFEAATKIRPNYHDAFNNWGVALWDQALTKSDGEADSLFRQAYAKYKTATEIKPDYPELFYNWGSTLSDQARTKSGEEANRLFVQAYEKYEAATKIKPNYSIAFNNWGSALSDHALTKTGVQANRLFAQSYEKYEAATNIRPSYHEAFHNWGAALSDQAKIKRGDEAPRLRALAEEKFEIARKLQAELTKG
ncbi:MAG TPA: SIR2 family protein [Pyrinomonadaceae bacterium]|jgi:tetratricopeptide (TPR) repeat protein|nr:SIR2 family protein [Pyrinomonadaceae bacterium]